MYTFTEFDAVSGFNQVYYQWVDTTTGAATTSPKVQLTFNNFDARQAMFGPTLERDMQVYNSFAYDYTSYVYPAGDTVCQKGSTLFFYLGDSDTIVGNHKQIHMGCLAGSSTMTESATVTFDLPLTGFNRAVDFDVKSYDVPKFNTTTASIEHIPNSVPKLTQLFLQLQTMNCICFCSPVTILQKITAISPIQDIASLFMITTTSQQALDGIQQRSIHLANISPRS